MNTYITQKTDNPRFTVSPNGDIYDDDFHWDAKLKISGDFADPKDKIRYAQSICDVLNNGEVPRE